MPNQRQRFRKRLYRAPKDKTQLSILLREIGKDVHGENIAAGLHKADRELADSSVEQEDQARILAVVADSQFKQGRFARAAQLYMRSATMTVRHERLWLRPLIGHVGALLKIPQVAQARLMALHAVAVAKKKMEDFDRHVRLANRTIAEQRVVFSVAVPPRVSVVATRMANLFLYEGEPQIADELFVLAIKESPGGANRAQQGLAKTALARGDYAQAMQLAANCIRTGNYRAKTLSAWAIVVSARRKLGGWRISDRLLDGLKKAPAGLRARTVLTIARELRNNDMRQWREIADRWLQAEGADFPIIQAELRKMILSSEKTCLGNASERVTGANRLLETGGLSPREWLSAVKELVKARLGDGSQVDLKPYMMEGRAKYGPDFAEQTALSLGVTCIKAKRGDLARALLRKNAETLEKKQAVWGKSIWALAELERGQGNHAAAAARYRDYFQEESMPVRFRLQAQIRWAEALISAGQPGALLASRPLIMATLRGIKEPDVLMNFARQLPTLTPELEEWSYELFGQGASLALEQFQKAEHPDTAVKMAFILARRQINDFDRAADAIRLWEGFDDKKKAWLWSNSTIFWEYLGLLVKAYVLEGQCPQAESFALHWLSDPATPPGGVVQIGIPYGKLLINSQRFGDALVLFDRLLTEAPMNPSCAYAWYWKALEAHKKNTPDERNRCIECLRRATGDQGGVPTQKDLYGKAMLLWADMDVARVEAQSTPFAAAELEILRTHLEGDLKRLP